MSRFERHVFVCVNDRQADDPRGACVARGGAEVVSCLKKSVYDLGLKGRVRVNKAGCLDQCAEGVSVVVYPEAVWYGRVTVADVPELVSEHLLNGRPVERLRTDKSSGEGDEG
jgi:(2Fe-2S) ferredoxin